MVGFYALKNFHHVKILRKIISQISLFIYLVFIFYLNWAFGAYRAINEETGANMLDILQGSATNVDTSSMQAHFPWTVDLTFTSLILVFIGIGFALVSLIDGYLFNDRYPGFGAIAKLRDETKKEIDRLRRDFHLKSIKNLEMKSKKLTRKDNLLLKIY